MTRRLSPAQVRLLEAVESNNLQRLDLTALTDAMVLGGQGMVTIALTMGLTDAGRAALATEREARKP